MDEMEHASILIVEDDAGHCRLIENFSSAIQKLGLFLAVASVPERS